MNAVVKILVDGPAWVGDMVMAQALFKILQQKHPQASIDVLAPAWTNPLLTAMPEVNRAIALPVEHGELGLRKRYRLAKSLRDQEYSWAILLRNSFKSALIPFWARIPRRTGWLGEWRYGLLNDARKLDKKAYPLMVERFIALGLPANGEITKPYPQPSLVINETRRRETLQKFQLDSQASKVLALCPGAEYGPAKRWPAEYFAEVANVKLQQGWQVWLLGSAKDREITERIHVLCNSRVEDLAGKTTLAEALVLLSVANLVVTNDSGLMHVAAALKRKLVVLYGSSSSIFTPPLTNNAKLLSLNLECSPCFERQCPLQHTDCLRQLTSSTVLTAMENLLLESRTEACLTA